MSGRYVVGSFGKLSIRLHREGAVRTVQSPGGDGSRCRQRWHWSPRRYRSGGWPWPWGPAVRARHTSARRRPDLRHAVDHRDTLRHQRLARIRRHRRGAEWARSETSKGSASPPDSPSGTKAGRACLAADRAPPWQSWRCTSCAAASMIAAQTELQGDLCRTLRAGRGHRVQAGDGGELPLQGRGHRRRHGVGSWRPASSP